MFFLLAREREEVFTGAKIVRWVARKKGREGIYRGRVGDGTGGGWGSWFCFMGKEGCCGPFFVLIVRMLRGLGLPGLLWKCLE